MVAGSPVQKVRALFLHGSNALALALVEDGRVGHAQNGAAPEHGIVLFCFPDHPRLLHRVSLDALVGGPGAAVQLPDAVKPALFVRRIPPHGKGLRVAEIVPPPDLPVSRDAERADHMCPPLVVVVGRVVLPLGEHLPGKAVPIAVEQGFLLRFRQRSQRAQVARVIFQQSRVVKHGAGDKDAGPPLHDLPSVRSPGLYHLHHPGAGRGRADEPCLHPSVADAAGVGRGPGVDPGIGAVWSVSAQQVAVLFPGEMGQLVKADKVVGLALVVVPVLGVVHAAKIDLCPAGEGPAVGAAVVPGFWENRLVIPHGLVNELPQLGKRLSDDEPPVVWDLHLPQSLDHQRVALSAACGPAIKRFVLGALHEPCLGGLW